MRNAGALFYDEMKLEERANRTGRVLALDLGKRRIGLALSDELRVTAQGLKTLERTNIREDLARLCQLASDSNVSLIVDRQPPAHERARRIPG